jgi:hypothetical protein
MDENKKRRSKTKIDLLTDYKIKKQAKMATLGLTKT